MALAGSLQLSACSCDWQISDGMVKSHSGGCNQTHLWLTDAKNQQGGFLGKYSVPLHEPTKPQQGHAKPCSAPHKQGTGPWVLKKRPPCVPCSSVGSRAGLENSWEKKEYYGNEEPDGIRQMLTSFLRGHGQNYLKKWELDTSTYKRKAQEEPDVGSSLLSAAQPPSVLFFFMYKALIFL